MVLVQVRSRPLCQSAGVVRRGKCDSTCTASVFVPLEQLLRLDARLCLVLLARQLLFEVGRIVRAVGERHRVFLTTQETALWRFVGLEGATMTELHLRYRQVAL